MNDETVLHKEEDKTMERTPQSLIDSTIEKVQNILNSKFPDYLEFDKGQYVISRGSTQVMVMVRPFTDKETSIECTANVVMGAKIDADLMQFLLRKNAELHFGSFGLLFDNTITFSHAIAGSNLDDSELELTVNTVSIISDYYDDHIVEIAGGKRAIDATTEDL